MSLHFLLIQITARAGGGSTPDNTRQERENVLKRIYRTAERALLRRDSRDVHCSKPLIVVVRQKQSLSMGKRAPIGLQLHMDLNYMYNKKVG